MTRETVNLFDTKLNSSRVSDVSRRVQGVRVVRTIHLATYLILREQRSCQEYRLKDKIYYKIL